MNLSEVVDFLLNINPRLNIADLRRVLANRSQGYSTIVTWIKLLNKINPELVTDYNLNYLLHTSQDNDMDHASRCIRILTPNRIALDRYERLTSEIYTLYYSIDTLDNAIYTSGTHGVILLKINAALESARVRGEQAADTIRAIRAGQDIAPRLVHLPTVPTAFDPIPSVGVTTPTTLNRLNTGILQFDPIPLVVIPTEPSPLVVIPIPITPDRLNARILQSAESLGINVDLGDRAYDFECPFTGEIMDIPTLNNNPDSKTPQRGEHSFMDRIAREQRKDPWTRKPMLQENLQIDEELQNQIRAFVFDKLQQLRAIPGYETVFGEFEPPVPRYSTLSLSA